MPRAELFTLELQRGLRKALVIRNGKRLAHSFGSMANVCLLYHPRI